MKKSKFVLFCLLLGCCASCGYINSKLGLSDDNIAEECAEDVIKGRTGVDIDLSPSTPEK